MYSKRITPEDIQKVYDNLQDPNRIDNVIRSVRLAFESLHIPFNDQNKEMVRDFILQKANRILMQG